MLPCRASNSWRSEKVVFSYPCGPKNPSSKSRNIPMPQATTPVSRPCCRAVASRLGNRSSPSESLTKTLLPSRRDSIGSPGHERFRPNPQAPVDGLRKLLGVAEDRVHLARTTGLDEVHDVLEVAVIAQRELSVHAVSTGEVEHGAPSAHIGGPEANRAEPGDAVVEGRAEPSGRQDVDTRLLPFGLGQGRQTAILQIDPMTPVDVAEVRDALRNRHLDPEAIDEGDQLLALAEFVPREGDGSAGEFHLEPGEQVRLHFLLRRKIVARTTVRGIHDQALDELGSCLAAGRPALWVEIARVQEIVDPDHGGTEHVAGILEDDAETVHVRLLAVRQGASRSSAAHLEDVEGLGRHDAARGQVIHVPMAHDAPWGLAHRVQDHLLEEVLYQDAALVSDAHQVRLVNTYRVGTRRRRPVQYLHRGQR